MVILDLDLPMLEEVVELVDSHLDKLDDEGAASEDPDAFVFDRIEYAVGLGFVACQNYISEWVRISKTNPQKALESGPRHRTGESMVALVNAAANYWKHHPAFEGEPDPQGRRTVELLAKLGVAAVDYKAWIALRELLRPLPVRFATLVPFLVAWREELKGGGRQQE